jgi:hypothetical protein
LPVTACKAVNGILIYPNSNAIQVAEAEKKCNFGRWILISTPGRKPG